MSGNIPFLFSNDWKMLVESTWALGFLARRIRARPVGVNKLFSSALQPEESKQVKDEQNEKEFDKLRHWYPEFLPNPDPRLRNLVREKLERRDMLRRRSVLYIPEFYVGSILAVTTSDKHVPKKTTRFVGICIQKKDCGLSSSFLLRNIIESHGIEIMYKLYSPVIHKIEVLRLEKRLDDELLYLRDAPSEYSTVPMDMVQEYTDETKAVPINTIKVPLNPRPWCQRYELKNLKGVILPKLSQKILDNAKKNAKPWEKYDLMDQYRKITPEEDQRDIFSEIYDELKKLEFQRKTEKRRKTFTKPDRQKLF